MQWVPQSGSPFGVRPMSVGELIDGAFQVMKRRFATLVTISAVIVVPFGMLSMLVSLSAQADVTTATNTDQFGNPTVDFGDFRTFFVGVVLVLIIGFVTQTIAAGAITHVVASDYLGSDVETKGAIRVGLARWGALLVSGLLLVLGVIGGLILCLIPGLFLAVAWTVNTPALIVERIGPAQALGRSLALVKPRWWPTFGFVILLSLMTGIASAMMSVPVGLIWSEGSANVVAAGVVDILTRLVITPFTAAATVLLYFDLRVRHEGFDVQILAQSLDLPAPIPAPEQWQASMQQPPPPTTSWGAPTAPPTASTPTAPTPWGQPDAPPPPPPPPPPTE